MAFHEASRTPLIRAHHAGLAAATGGQLAGRLAQLPELARPVTVPVSEPTFSSAVVHVPGASLQQPPDQPAPALSILQLSPLAPMALTVLSRGLLGPVGEMSLRNEKNVDAGPSRGSCFHNLP